MILYFNTVQGKSLLKKMELNAPKRYLFFLSYSIICRSNSYYMYVNKMSIIKKGKKTKKKTGITYTTTATYKNGKKQQP